MNLPIVKRQPGVEQSVRARYSAAATNREDALCCATGYRQEYLDVIPAEIDMHEPWNELIVGCVLVEFHALNE